MLEQQVENRHELGLTGTAAAVQAAGLAVGGIDRAAYEPEYIIEARDQLRRDHLLGEGLLWLGDTFREVEDEVPFAHPFGQIENLRDQFVRHFGTTTKDTKKTRRGLRGRVMTTKGTNLRRACR